MKKAVEVQVRVYVEGEAEPTADFAAIGKRVVAEALRLGGRQVHGYTLSTCRFSNRITEVVLLRRLTDPCGMS